MQFPDRDLTSQYISSSYQDVVQRYLSGSTDWLLDGLGYTILGIPTSSVGSIVLTQDQTASFATSASWAPPIPSNYSVSSSWASESLHSITSDATVSASYALFSELSNTASISILSEFADTASVAGDASRADVAVSSSWASSSIIAISASWSPVPISASWVSASNSSSFASVAGGLNFAINFATSSTSSSWSSASISASYALTSSYFLHTCSIQTDNYSLTGVDYTVCFSGSTPLSASLPSAITVGGRIYNIKNVTTYNVTVTGSQNIDGDNNQVVTQWNNLTIQSNGTQWIIL